MAVKGQETLDAANARRKGTRQSAAPQDAQPAETNDPTMLAMTVESGYEKPKTLRQLETIVESNALKGAGFWRKAADALLAIKTNKLWKDARDENGDKYPSFVVYAEERFGFKKTYAYDLVKAAQRKPEAVTEGSARAEMRADREPKPIDRATAIGRIETAWTRFENAAGDLRDRVIDDEDFVNGYDRAVRIMENAPRDFFERFVTINAETVSPLRSDSADAENADEDDVEYVTPDDLEHAMMAGGDTAD